MTQAKVVMQKLRMQAKTLAKHLDIAPSTVSRWDYPSEDGGTGGRIPPKYYDRIVELSDGRVRYEDFVSPV
jgi:hypothetical protein